MAIGQYVCVTYPIARSHPQATGAPLALYSQLGKPMNRYFFNLLYHDCNVIDRDGVEFQSLEEALADARRAIAEMALDAAKLNQIFYLIGIPVCEADGCELAVVWVDATTISSPNPLLH